MDWYLQAEDRGALTALRREVRDYLQRHSEPESDLADAQLVLEEVVGNAFRHAGGAVWVSLTWREVNPVLTVYDLGPGFDPRRVDEAAALPVGDPVPPDPDAEPSAVDDLDVLLAEGGRGLFLVTRLAGALEAAAREGGGMVVRAPLPVKRPAAVSHDPPRTTSDSLPTLDEARPEGGFGRESFLRALVVQLARAVEFQQGPDAAESAVTQVGLDVGGQMEAEFRAARGVVGRMPPEQLAECYVRLKHAIDGGFYVVEVTPDRIVLGNTRCPFGDVVTRAPSLCRMTSSVFGGIAARNSNEGAAVLLEERIAVGDPGCRVVVHLGEPPAAEQPLTHRYARPHELP